MSKSNGQEQEQKIFTSMAHIGGRIRKISLREDSAFLLVQVVDQENSKWIPCTVYEDKILLRRLENYDEGDHIHIRGFVRAYSQKKDGEWMNNVDVRITEIRTKDPVRSRRKEETQQREEAQRAFQGATDDDIPF